MIEVLLNVEHVDDVEIEDGKLSITKYDGTDDVLFFASHGKEISISLSELTKVIEMMNK
ncbi:hypothetical protein FJQ98_16270 [Lysinibacillus agricola]|uniref:Uncharacterized protein n=1 Tax=Lysinibacillus agricola TaxID=2590012 RepID=A0ABX7ALN2_9BACI|nr:MULTISPECIES: hypothetical protein [Lysinibacillus]QQP10800.1 hypothetical protein FJQ98_16270 [Lysinibacillus agricola]